MPSIDPQRLVFIDESGAKTNMTRLRGRAIKGERVYDSAPHGHWYTTTMISSIRVYGDTACMTIAGPTTTEVFRAYIKEVLLPTLKHGDIVIMDNLSSHKATSIEALINSVGASVRFLPAYSPDLNPIEKMWSKVKEFLRSTKARTHESLLGAIAAALTTVTKTDAINWFASCGYTFN